ncbi:BA75_01325T0 [Komagataella pastoris]|uniref:BA75_01325T0 n=1 Tax=Komagataella pastoris TaxID=4922 RepID=A0A1B2J787_PICPA|nr:BA75_01325T0 [Komagataella pastoris]
MKAITRVFLMVAVTVININCGTLYLYSAYSPQLAQRLGYTTRNASNIATAGQQGVLFSAPLVGLIIDKYGYTPAMILGSIMSFSAYFLLKIQFDHETSSVWRSSMYLCSVGIGSTFVNSATLKCSMSIFPNMKGLASSLPLAMYGASATFFSLVGATFFPGDTSAFLGFIAWAGLVISSLCVPIVCYYDFSLMKGKDKKLEEQDDEDEVNDQLLSPRFSSHDIELSHFQSDIVASPRHSRPISPFEVEMNHPSNTPKWTLPSKLVKSPEMEIRQLVRRPEFWMLFAVLGFLAGLGQMYIYSCGYMVKALTGGSEDILSVADFSNGVDKFPLRVEKYLQTQQQLQVSVISISSTLGRLSSGVVGDLTIKKFKIQRTWFLFVPAIILFATQIMGLIVSSLKGLLAISMLLGFGYGFTYSTYPAIVCDLYGLKNFSMNWGVFMLSAMLPNMLLNHLFGSVYDKHIKPLNVEYLKGRIDDKTMLELVEFLKKKPMKVCDDKVDCYREAFDWTTVISFVIIQLVVYINIRGKKMGGLIKVGGRLGGNSRDSSSVDGEGET